MHIDDNGVLVFDELIYEKPPAKHKLQLNNEDGLYLIEEEDQEDFEAQHYGSSEYCITEEMIESMRNGKLLAISDSGEYSVIIRIKKGL